jgi:hypothetical protein
MRKLYTSAFLFIAFLGMNAQEKQQTVLLKPAVIQV